MTFAEFKKKWSRYQGKESSAYQEHFNDLCRLLGQPTPNEADPSGADFFCFQKRVVKDAELFQVETPDATEPNERGFADVWKKGCFAWEYKGKKKNLDEAYKQLLRYRESLLNPPLLVVCDFDRCIIKTNFNGTVQEVHEFTNAEIDAPKNLGILRALFTDPDFLKPQRTTAQVTKDLAVQIAEIAKSLQGRESVELADAKSRKEVNVAQKKNLRIARFLNRIVFCFFAEDTGLLPKNLFSDIAKTGIDDPKLFAETLEKLFAVMATGGTFGKDKIRHFNGHLFEEASVFELTEAELRALATAGEADWQFIEPSIMGTLFERALEPEQRSQLGAHYTGEADIKTLVEPVLMQPFRREWSKIKGELAPLLVGTARCAVPVAERSVRRRNELAGGSEIPLAKSGKSPAGSAQRANPTKAQACEQLAAFQKKLSSVTVLDPACGSGNFLYVSLQLLLGLEKEVITFATQLGFAFKPQVTVPQLRAIEINPYAFELAQVSVQIGWLQWRRDNGFDNDRTPVLQNLDGFQNEDALLVPHFRNKARTLKEAQAGEHAGDDALKFYTEREWPACDVIVGNPPFIGNKRLRSELGDDNAKAVFEIYGNRLPATSDFCCYWFEKARELIADGKCKRAGLLATTGSKQISSRHAFERIQETARIFFAISDRDWFDAGTAIRICMVGFGGADTPDKPTLDGKEVAKINADLSTGLDTTGKQYLRANEKLCFMGTTKVGDFDIPQAQAVKMLSAVNPHGKPNSDVLRPFRNGSDLVQEDSQRWIVDFGVGTPIESASLYAEPFKHIVESVKPERLKNNDKWRRNHWWLLGRTLPDFREATAKLPRYIGTARVAKHRLFVWQDSPVLPDSKVIAIAFGDDFHFGVLQSQFHIIWTNATQALHGGERPTYNPTECFETFPFPFAEDLASAVRRDIFVELSAKNVPGAVGAAYSAPDGAKSKSTAAGYKDSAPDGAGQPRLSASAQSAIANRQSEIVAHRAAIAAAAQELNALRERWLNPPEWTAEKILEFPGTIGGPWDRYIVPGSARAPRAAADAPSAASEKNPTRASDSTREGACAPQTNQIGLVRYPRLEPRDADCAAKLKKRTLTNLYNERPAWLDLAHKKLDAAVAAAYGFPADLTDEQILEKLLALNLERAAEEAKAAKQPKKLKAQREKAAHEII